jgi:cyclohexyl-isocyanide hydratase
MIVGMLIFPEVTQLDFTGPYEVISKWPGVEMKVISPSPEPVASTGGLRFIPDTTIGDAPRLDMLFVPGGSGVDTLLNDRPVLEFLRAQGEGAAYVTSVCTGALLLGAAGLLRGYRATTHWLSLDLLPLFGATPVTDRVVVDRNRITGGGVTAGIDLALVMTADLYGPETARMLQLVVEYNPAPPYDSGHPSVADPMLVRRVLQARAGSQAARREKAERAALLYCRQ